MTNDKPKFTRGNKSPTTQSKRTFFPPVPFVDELVVPSIFEIFPDEKDGHPIVSRVLTYGEYIKVEVVAPGLNVDDHSVFIALAELIAKHGQVDFITSLAEFCTLTGKSYTEESKKSIEDSLFRLAMVTMRITITKGPRKGDWEVGHLIGHMQFRKAHPEKLHITCDNYLKKNLSDRRSYMVPINPQRRLELKGDGAKEALPFFQFQAACRGIDGDLEYEIGLEKFCLRIGLSYDPKDKPKLWKRRYYVRNLLRGLVESGNIISAELTKKDIIKVKMNIPALLSQDLAKEPSKSKAKNEPFFKKEQRQPAEPSLPGQDGLRYIVRVIGEKFVTKNLDKARQAVIAIQHVQKHIYPNTGETNLFKKFIDYLKDWRGVIVNHGSLDPHSKPFRTFMIKMQYEMPPNELLDQWMESDKEKVAREAQEQKEREERTKAREAERETDHENQMWANRKFQEIVQRMQEEFPNLISAEQMEELFWKSGSIKEITKRFKEGWKKKFGAFAEEFVGTVTDKLTSYNGPGPESLNDRAMARDVWERLIREMGD